MHALDSQLEALALNYLRHGFSTAVNNMWTWLAVFTAAVSFWRIRASASPPKSNLRLLTSDALLPSPTPATVVSSSSSRPSPQPLERKADRLSSSTSMASCEAERHGTTKGKFTVFYKECDGECADGSGRIDDDDINGEGDGVKLFCGERGDDWERRIGMRLRDIGLYRFQDLTALDGSVVRLWENCRRRSAW